MKDLKNTSEDENLIFGNNFLLLLLPADIQQFLKNLSLPIRFIGDPLNLILKKKNSTKHLPEPNQSILRYDKF